jgi:hypothetical protein
MLGYNHTQSSKEVLQHHESLKKRIPGKFHSELDCAYEWVKQPQFMTALGHNTVESWNHLAHSMDNPPMRVIHHYAKAASVHTTIVEPTFTARTSAAPVCFLCLDQLAENIFEKVSFDILLCKCGKMHGGKLFGHKACIAQFVAKEKRCERCREYYIQSSCRTSLSSQFFLA